MKKSLLLLTALLATGLIAAGCGDDDDDGGDDAETLSKEEYLAKGNQICTEGNQALNQAGEELQNPSPEEIEAFASDTLVPNIQGQIDDLREGIPEGDEDQVNGMLDDAEAALDEIEADPTILQSNTEDPFAEVNQQLNAYGLTVCGSG